MEKWSLICMCVIPLFGAVVQTLRRDVGDFENGLKHLVSKLGYQELQDQYDKLHVNSTQLNGTELLQKLVDAVETNFNKTKKALYSLRSAIAHYQARRSKLSKINPEMDAEYNENRSANVTENLYPKCSDVPNTGNGINDFNHRLKELKYNGCYVLPSNTQLEDEDFLPTISQTMKKNMKEFPDLKWQYYASTKGDFYLYPPLHFKEKTFDPHIRSWYVDTATVHPKDVVIAIDNSGSMDFTNIEGQTLMEIVKDGAKMMVETLNPKDRVAIVAFSDDATVPTTRSCYENTLAVATPQNKNVLTDFIDQLKGMGLTNYVAALKKAFTYFQGINATDYTRDKFLLFLSDGMPTVGGGREKILEVIDEIGQHLNNNLVIMTYGIGKALQDDDNRQLLYDMATKIQGEHNGVKRVGNFTNVTCPDVMRKSVTEYYTKQHTYREVGEGTQPIYSLPYQDTGGLGLVMSMCLPVQLDDEFNGVTCIDIRISDLLHDVINFQHGEMSYAFLITSRGRAVFHPLLPTPDIEKLTSNSDVGVVDIRALERDTAVGLVISSMRNGESGIRDLLTQRILARGDTAREGSNVQWEKSTYMWAPIKESSNFSVCIVITNHDRRITFPDRNLNGFAYHNFITQGIPDSDICRLKNRIALRHRSTVKFAPILFQNSLEYKNGNETKENITRIIGFMEGKMNNTVLLQDSIKGSVAFTQLAENFWLKDGLSSPFTWRFMATIDGVLRIYPGIKMDKLYDARQRPWFKRTLSNKGKIVLSPVYRDSWGAGIILTLSKALCRGDCVPFQSEVPVVAMLGGDITMNYFQHLLVQMVPECAEKYKCLVIDNSGYLVMHDDFIFPTNRNAPVIVNIHITVKEPEIAKKLVETDIMKAEGCIDILKIDYKYFWKVKELSVKAQRFRNFTIYPIEGTNVFLIMKNQAGQTNILDSSLCQNWVKPLVAKQVADSRITCANVPEQVDASNIIDCKCSSVSAEYDYCASVFDMKKMSDVWPTCISYQRPPEVDLKDDDAKMNQFPPCVQAPVCSKYTNRSACYSKIGCNWCVVDEEGESLPEEFCSLNEDCFFGILGHADPYGHPGNSPKIMMKNKSNQGTVIIIACSVAVAALIGIIIILTCVIKRRRRLKRREDQSRLIGNHLRVSLIDMGKDNGSMLWNNMESIVSGHNSLASLSNDGGIPLQKLESQPASSTSTIHHLTERVEALVHRLEGSFDRTSSLMSGVSTHMYDMPRFPSTENNHLPYPTYINQRNSVASEFSTTLPRSISFSSVLSSPYSTMNKTSSSSSSSGLNSRPTSADIPEVILRNPLKQQLAQQRSLQRHSSNVPTERSYQVSTSSRQPSERTWPGEPLQAANLQLRFIRSEEGFPEEVPRNPHPGSRPIKREPSERSCSGDTEWANIPEETTEELPETENSVQLRRPLSHSASFRLRRAGGSSRRRFRPIVRRSSIPSSSVSAASIQSYIQQCLLAVVTDDESGSSVPSNPAVADTSQAQQSKGNLSKGQVEEGIVKKDN